MPTTKKPAVKTAPKRQYTRKPAAPKQFTPSRPSVVAQAKAEVAAKNQPTFTQNQLVVAVALAVSVTLNVIAAFVVLG